MKEPRREPSAEGSEYTAKMASGLSSPSTLVRRGGGDNTAAAVRDGQCSERRRYSSSMVRDGKEVRVIKDSLCHKINYYCQPRSHSLSKHEEANVPR